VISNPAISILAFSLLVPAFSLLAFAHSSIVLACSLVSAFFLVHIVLIFSTGTRVQSRNSLRGEYRECECTTEDDVKDRTMH